jgi:CRISPR system Cascade subunit CasA
MSEYLLNLLTDPWLPTRRSTLRESIRPDQITASFASDPILALDWPRPDFRIACLEMLIGLLTLACPPVSARDWLRRWHHPPSPQELAAAFAPYAFAFALDGPGPRFLQDQEDLVSESEDPALLLMDQAGASTLHAKPATPITLSRAAAAMALYTLQNWAPEGGRGHFTGLRGGGPLVTLVRPASRHSLWHLLWANTPIQPGPADPAELPRILPWLGPTPTTPVHPEAGAHPLQAFWGMPRRIRLDFAPGDGRLCSLTGMADAVLVTGRRQRPNGVRYADWGRMHPLTPHRLDKASRAYISIKPQPGGIGYRHWLGLMTKDREGILFPADAIATWRGRAMDADEAEGVQLIAAGYDMKQMKARAFVEREMPLPGGDAETNAKLDSLAQLLVGSAGMASDLLRQALRAALFSPGATVKDATVLSIGRERLWDGTEAAFFAALDTARRDESAQQGALAEWVDLLQRSALALFDELAPMPFDGGKDTARHAQARRQLRFALTGYGKAGAAFFTPLGLPLPESAKARDAA